MSGVVVAVVSMSEWVRSDSHVELVVVPRVVSMREGGGVVAHNVINDDAFPLSGLFDAPSGFVRAGDAMWVVVAVVGVVVITGGGRNGRVSKPTGGGGDCFCCR